MTENIQNKINKVLGLAIDGSDKYIQSSYITLFSFLKYNSDKIDEVWIMTTLNNNKFDDITKIVNKIYNIEIKILIEDNIHKYEKFGNYKGNLFAWLKTSLFAKIRENDFLIMLDIDTLVTREININQIMKSIKKNKVTIAAVPAQRPVLERFSNLNLSNPYDYFNGGVIFSFNSEKWRIENLLEQHEEIINLGLQTNYYWGEQCLYNYVFLNDYFKLPPIYNVHNGYISKEYNNVLNINSLLENYILKYNAIIHFSDGKLYKNNFHPYKNLYENEVEVLKKLFVKYNFINLCDFESINYKNSRIDYFLQSIYFRKRNYSNIYYPSIKKILKKIIRKVLKN